MVIDLSLWLYRYYECVERMETESVNAEKKKLLGQDDTTW